MQKLCSSNRAVYTKNPRLVFIISHISSILLRGAASHDSNPWPSFSVLRYTILHLAILKSHIVQMSRACQVIQIAQYNWPATIIIYITPPIFMSSRNHHQHWFHIFFRVTTKILHSMDQEPISRQPIFKTSLPVDNSPLNFSEPLISRLWFI